MQQLDMSWWWQAWTGTEPVSYTSQRNTGSMACDIPTALRSELTKREKAASNAAYIGAEINWLLPAALLPPGFVPKSGDQLVASQGNEAYAILDVKGQCRDQSGYQVWSLRGLNLAIVYDLKDTVTIERAEIVYDAAGAELKFWPSTDKGRGKILYGDVLARVQEHTREVIEERGIQGFKGTHTVFVSRQVPGVTFEDRIALVKAGVTYYLNIVGLHNPERIDELPALDAVLAP